MMLILVLSTKTIQIVPKAGTEANMALGRQPHPPLAAGPKQTYIDRMGIHWVQEYY